MNKRMILMFFMGSSLAVAIGGRRDLRLHAAAVHMEGERRVEAGRRAGADEPVPLPERDRVAGELRVRLHRPADVVGHARALATPGGAEIVVGNEVNPAVGTDL